MRGLIKPFAILIFVITSLFLFAQNNPPVAVKDSIHVYFITNNFDTLVNYNVISNDFDPEEDLFEIAEVYEQGNENEPIYFSDSTIDITYYNSLSTYLERIYHYRLRETNDTTNLSNWTTVYINPGIDPTYPIARNDTFTVIPGFASYFNLLKNDFHPLGDSLNIGLYWYGSILNDSIVKVELGPYEIRDIIHSFYQLCDTSENFARFDMGLVYLNIQLHKWYDSLNINNINARFNCFGNNFWNLQSKPHFKVPNGSEISSVFSQALWIGGLDENENLHVAVERYRVLGEDYWPGPVSNIYDSVYDLRWLHVWKLNRTEIEYHKAHWWEAGYEPISDILSWPGNGDVELGQSEFIAPFEDINENGFYEPLQGDAPIIKGDQSLFFVFNDARHPHTESGGIPLGIEIRAMAYAFDAPEDSVLWNTIFWHYDIENRSDTNYHDVYMGVFTDTDLGFGWDDRIECDVEKGMYFVYNGIENDGGSQQPGYGEHPPALGVQILAGSYLEPDGLDNPKFDLLGNQIVDESINGLNFGDGIIDNERLGMTGFMYFNGGGNAAMSDPQVASEYYDFLRSYWKDQTKLQYGGYGYPSALAEGPDCNYYWPGDSDPYNWGTYGLWPNGGYNQNGYYWTEEQVGANPDDRRGMGRTGPFTLSVGQVQSIDVAMPWARDYEGTAWSSALLLKERAAYLKELFQNNPDFFAEVEDIVGNDKKLQVFPNPASNKIRILLPDQNSGYMVYIFDSRGILMYEKTNFAKNNPEINIQQLSPGLYIIKLVLEKEILTETFIKL